MGRHGVGHHLPQAAHDVGVEIIQLPVRASGEQHERINPTLGITGGGRALPGVEEVQHPGVLKVRFIGACTNDHQAADQIGVFKCCVHRSSGTHGKANDDCGSGIEVADECGHVVTVAKRDERGG
ncbi:hypothetical protein GCM10027562_11260 [Arthrobacter pigmenti]